MTLRDKLMSKITNKSNLFESKPLIVICVPYYPITAFMAAVYLAGS